MLQLSHIFNASGIQNLYTKVVLQKHLQMTKVCFFVKQVNMFSTQIWWHSRVIFLQTVYGTVHVLAEVCAKLQRMTWK